MIVVETDINGGTMHTVKYARNFNKTVGCFYHESDIWKTEPKTQRKVQILRDGASMLSS